MDNEKTTNTYRDVRGKWARKQEAAFRQDVTVLCDEFGIDLDPETLDTAYFVCVDKLCFGYPSEYRLAEIISPDDATYEDVLAYAASIMKKYRKQFAFYRYREGIL